MSADLFVLDTSALLALVEDEPGADRVEEILRCETALLPWPALLELTYITRRERGEQESEIRYALAKELPVTVLWETTEPLLLTAARVKADHPVSFADSLIAAYAVLNGATLVHKDPEYETLAHELPLEALPYKTKH